MICLSITERTENRQDYEAFKALFSLVRGWGEMIPEPARKLSQTCNPSYRQRK